MRRSAIFSSCTAALVALAAACATSPVDDPMLGADLSAASPTEPPPDSAKLPPPSTTSAASDAGLETKDAAPAPPDAAPPPPPDAAPPPPPPPPPGNAVCDPDDPLNLIKFLATSTMDPCPCAAGKCCYQGLTCL